MGNPIPCDICGEEEAILLCGNTQTGEQTAFCLAHWALTGLHLAKGLLDPDVVLDTLGITGSESTPGDGATAAPSRKRGRRKAALSTPETPQESPSVA